LREPTIATIGRASAAADRQQRRRIVDHLQPRRIIRLAPGNERDAELVRQGDLPHGLFARVDLRGTARAAALRKRRQCFERRPRAAEMIDQRAKRTRPNIRTANEAQPIDALLVGQPDALAADFIPFSVAHLGPAVQAHLSPCRCDLT
jgi:hypothetical protein